MARRTWREPKARTPAICLSSAAFVCGSERRSTRDIPLANFMAWFVFIGPGFMEFSHFLFSIFEGGPYHYFFGMGTAVLPMIPGIYGMYRLYTESRTGVVARRRTHADIAP